MLNSHKTYGFSLLEIMVVIFLMALFSTVTILRLGVGQSTQIESEARQFAGKLNLLMDESLLSGKAYRIVFDQENHSYEYQQFDEKWNTITTKPYEKKVLKNTLAFDLETTIPASEKNNQRSEESIQNIDSNEKNTVLINTDGVTAVFVLRFGEKNQSNSLDREKSFWSIIGGQTITVSDVVEN